MSELEAPLSLAAAGNGRMEHYLLCDALNWNFFQALSFSTHFTHFITMED